MPLQGHTSLFVSELFPDLPEDSGVDIREFEGILRITSGEFMAPLALRSAGAKLTSTPTLRTRLNGFTPTSTVEFAQNLVGTSPTVKWILHQNDNDFVLKSLKISAPDLGLNRESVEVGDALAFGYFAQGSNSRVFDLVVKGTENLEFDLLALTGEGTFRQGSGRVEGSSSQGFSLELTVEGAKPFTEAGGDADQVFFFPAGLINAPADAGPITVTAEFTSVSTRADGDNSIMRRTTQEIVFTQPDPNTANLESILPEFLTPGTNAFLKGTNLGDSPTVLFPSVAGGVRESEGVPDESGAIEVLVPTGIADGPVQLDNGSGAGNLHQIKTLFAPRLEAGSLPAGDATVTQTGSSAGFFLRFLQEAEQFVLSEFTVELQGSTSSLSSLVVGAIVGDGSMQQGSSRTEFSIRVQAAEATEVVLELVNPDEPDNALGFRIGINRSITEDGSETLLFNYGPVDTPEEPELLDARSVLELLVNLRSLPVEFSTAFLSVEMRSGPTRGGGAASAMTANQVESIAR